MFSHEIAAVPSEIRRTAPTPNDNLTDPNPSRVQRHARPRDIPRALRDPQRPSSLALQCITSEYNLSFPIRNQANPLRKPEKTEYTQRALHPSTLRRPPGDSRRSKRSWPASRPYEGGGSAFSVAITRSCARTYDLFKRLKKMSVLAQTE